MSQMKAGAILSYFSLFITLLIALIYTPIMIRMLGQAEYGLFALVGSMAAYFSVMDLGLGNAVVRYTARNRAIGNKKLEASINGMFLILYSLIGLLVIIVGMIIYYELEYIFGASLTEIEIQKAEIMVIILIINFALSFPLSIFGSIMQAYEKFVFVKTINIIRSILIPILTLPILFLGYGAISMVLISSLINILSLLINAFYSARYLKISFHFGKIDLNLLKEILGYSFFVFLGVIVDQIYWNTDQFILGILSGTIPVAIYAIAMQFITQYMRFSTSISGMFLPKVSMMVAKNASNLQLTEMMLRYGRLQFLILSFILSGFILFGQNFINIWAGFNYKNAYYIVLIIMIPLIVPLIQNLGISILYAKNLQKFRSIILIFVAVLNVVLTIPLIREYGGIGAALATSISLIIGNVLIMNLYYKYRLGLDIFLFWRSIIFLSIPVLISLIIGGLIEQMLSDNNIFLYILKITIYTIVFFTSMWLLGLNSYEKNLLASIMIKVKSSVLKMLGILRLTKGV